MLVRAALLVLQHERGVAYEGLLTSARKSMRADAFLAATTSRPPPPPPPRGALASGEVGGLQGIVEDEDGEALSQAADRSDALGRSQEGVSDAHKEEEEEEDSVPPAGDALGAGGGRAGRGAASDLGALAPNNRTFVATDAQVDLRLILEPAAAAAPPPSSAHAVAGDSPPAGQRQNARVWRRKDGLEPEHENTVQQQQQSTCAVLDRDELDQGPEGAAPAAAVGVYMLHVHLVRATNLFAKNQPRPAVAHQRRRSEVAGGGGEGQGGAAGDQSYDVWPTRTAVCLVRLKVLGAEPGEAAAAACNTAVNAQTFDTPDPSFDFICGFQIRCPRKACLDISLWHAEKLLALDAHLIFGKHQQVGSRSDPGAAGVDSGAQAGRGRDGGSTQDGVWPACAGASHDSLAFLRATDIQNFLSKGATSAAYMGSVQVSIPLFLRLPPSVLHPPSLSPS